MKVVDGLAYRFGAFVLAPRERLLLHDGEPVALAGKAFDLLVALVSRAGHLVTKDELLERVWPGVVVEEVNLSVNMSVVRKALARSPAALDWIETLHRQGYRFNGQVESDAHATVQRPHVRGQNAAGLEQALAQTGVKRAVGRRGFLAAGVSASTLVAWSGWRAFGRQPAYAAVAVLPFTVDEPANLPLADGIAEEVINALTRVTALRVVPRASAFRFRGADPVEAGLRLGAAAVVTGTVVGDGQRMSMHVELVNVAQAAQVWASGYEVQPSELPQLQARLIDDVQRSLGVHTSAGERHQGARDPTHSADAYRAYLQGRFLWNQRSEPELRRAVELFRRAIQIDPDFALAQAALADTYTTLGYLSLDSPSATFPLARTHAVRALAIDPFLSQAHASLGYIRLYFDWDWSGAAESFRRAIELNPNDPTAHQWYAVYLLAAGQPGKAMHEISVASQLDPLSLAINTDLGFHHYYNRRYPEAIAQLQAVLGMKGDFGLAHLWLARSYLEVGKLEQSLAATSRAEAGAPEWPVLVAARGYTLGVMARTEEAQSVRDEMVRLSQRRFVTAYGMALVQTGLGDRVQAYKSLERAFDERSHWLVWLRLDPRWKALRGDARFSEFVKRMQFPA